MNGINLMKIFQRAVGWCKTVYGFKCLTREQKPLSGHVIFRTPDRKQSPAAIETADVETACQ